MPPTKDIPFAPAIGRPMLIQPAGYNGKLKTSFVGMDTGRYVIASLTPFVGEMETLSKYLDKGRKAHIFYTSDGVVRGYRVQLQGYTTSPLKHIYLTYPNQAESFNLRGHDRITCHLPGFIVKEGKNVRCLVQNLSSGGCGVCINPDDMDHPNSLASGDLIQIRFQLTTMPDKIALQGQIMGMRDADGFIIAGTRFISPTKQALEEIERFLSFVIEYRI